MRWKTAALALGALALTMAVLLIATIRERLGFGNPDNASVVAEIKPLNQLATIRYSIQRVVGIRESKIPFGEESILIMVQGEVVAGVDLSHLAARDVHYSAPKSIVIELPSAKLLDTFLDEKQTKVWDRQITWWTPWVPYDADLEHKARLKALDDVRQSAIEMGILGQAQRNAETAIRGLLSAAGLKASFTTHSLD